MIKRYIIYVYILIYPLTYGYIPNIDLGMVELDPLRLYLLVPLLYLAHIFIRNHGRIKISKESGFMMFYILFSLFNSFRTDQFAISHVLNYFVPILFIILIENLEYKESDFVPFFRALTILVVVVFLVSLLQALVDPKIYSGIQRRTFSEDKYLAFGSTFRNASIFGAIDFYQAGMAIGMLCVIFMFLNFEKVRLKYLVLCFMMLISTFLTYTRSNWMIPLIAFVLFIHFKPWKKKIGLIIATLAFSLVFYLQFYQQLEQSQLYRDRVVEGTYEGRFHSIDIYVKHILGKNMLLGFGAESVTSDEFRLYGRGQAHNGYLEILFRNGLVGFFLYFGFWYYLFKRSKLIYKRTGNGVFIVFILVFLASNFVYKFIAMYHYSYLLMILYINMCYQVYVKNKKNPLPGSAEHL